VIVGGRDRHLRRPHGRPGRRVAATLLERGAGPLAAVAAALTTGAAVGLFNGTLANAFRIPPFIVTLGSFSMAEGLTLVWTRGASVR